MHDHSLFDFQQVKALHAFRPIHDVVMGGLSEGGLQGSDAQTAIFQGTVSLENGGGFASVRAPLETIDLSAWQGLRLKVCGDGKRYKCTLKTDAAFDGLVYQAAFIPAAQQWSEHWLPFDAFQPTFRGRVQTHAPALNRQHIHSLGLMISEKQAGPFRLEIAHILASNP